MKRFKNTFFYAGVIGICGLLMYGTYQMGLDKQEGRHFETVGTGKGHWPEFLDTLTHNLQHPLAILLAQIITIIVAARLFGWIFKKIGQPYVIGEIIAGIALGPSFFGSYFPEFSALLFPVASLGNLQMLSQVGLVMFMFVIGMELDLNILRNKAHDAVVISHASIVIPFSLGMVLAYFIYLDFAPEHVEYLSFSLFMGIAMSITAFPVLARIVQERGIQKTRLGTVVLTCAAADDITAWCILAIVIAIVKAGSFVSSLYVIGLAVVYVWIMIKLVRPFLKRIGDLHAQRESLGTPIVAIFFIVLIISAYLSEIIGIHALFGAFMAGAIMPENKKFRHIFIEKVEDVALVLLLPLFFVYTGLRTQIGLLNDIELWKTTGWIILVAVAGKFIGSALAARFVGQNWKDSLTIGALMNTRGLMELVVLNIGYDLGVLSPEIFAMLVVMALLTTFMTGPALDFINWAFRKQTQIAPDYISDKTKYNILLSFGNPDTGISLLRLANSMTRKNTQLNTVTALHLSADNMLPQYDWETEEKESFAPLITLSDDLKQPLTTHFKVSNDINADIVDIVNEGNYDLLLIGVGQSIFEGSLLGKILGFTTRFINPERIFNQMSGKEQIFSYAAFDDRTSSILSGSEVSVGVLIDKGQTVFNKILVPVFSDEDSFLIDYAKKFITNNNSQVVILDVQGILRDNSYVKEAVRAIEHIASNHISLMHERVIDKTFVAEQQLMLVSLKSWKKLVESKSVWLTDAPSTLIIKHKP
ncbi:cation:proton antiporter [Sphingobacterium spiritivorum]|uniref:cation:proton antiporter n=1 Tax=Sphingobacterium spiritivorum TaxID=258 RepID=UPI00191B87D7|nr:cation:proton antiporter [Sphingobacterium spiritivorum]QQT26365.1 cation:proton antiporter [Sphingobacterium spiritivorum]